MKKLTVTALIILSVALAMIIIGAILGGVSTLGAGAKFDASGLIDALTTIGYVAAALSGIVLTGMGVATAIKGKDEIR